MIFHPTYLLVNARLLGQIECSDDTEEECISSKTYVAAFGMGSSTIGILLLAPGICFCFGLSNVVPQAFGANNFKLCGAYLNRTLITSAMIFVPLLVPLMFIENFFTALN